MNWQESPTFTLKDLITYGFWIFGIGVSVTLLKTSLSNVQDKVIEIRETQIENTKKNDLRWQSIESRQNIQDTEIKLLNQRIEALEKRNM